MEKTTLKKNKDGYGYKYTELAEIHKYLEENNMRYYQTIETSELNGCDYIMTYRFIDGKWEEKPKRGCKVTSRCKKSSTRTRKCFDICKTL